MTYLALFFLGVSVGGLVSRLVYRVALYRRWRDESLRRRIREYGMRR